MTNKRTFVWSSFRMKTRISHNDTSKADLVFKGENGNLTVFEFKHVARSNHVEMLKQAEMLKHEWSKYFGMRHILPRPVVRNVSSNLAKPNDASHLTMPEISEKLLPFILPKQFRVAVTGDLAEDFRTYAAKWGRRYALRWLWWEIAGLCIRRFGPTAIITAAAAWFRRKFGW